MDLLRACAGVRAEPSGSRLEGAVAQIDTVGDSQAPMWAYQVNLDKRVRRKLIADAYSQENVVSYRWRVALYAELAPLDNEINIGTGVQFTFRIFTLAN
jgi:hypothetical protein